MQSPKQSALAFQALPLLFQNLVKGSTWVGFKLTITKIPFRRYNQLSNQTMSPTCTQSQFCTATPISSFVQDSDFILAIAFVICLVYFNWNFAQIITIVCTPPLSAEELNLLPNFQKRGGGLDRASTLIGEIQTKNSNWETLTKNLITFKR